jgi:SAM-dependent methyltransferase
VNDFGRRLCGAATSGSKTTCLRREQSSNGAPLGQPSQVAPARLLTASASGRRQHVQLVYDAIARQWHGTRYKAWPRVVDFVRDLPPRSLVADLGCGNGKLAPSFRDAGHIAIGCDFSAELVGIAAGEMGMQARAHHGCGRPRPIHAPPGLHAQRASFASPPIRPFPTHSRP